MRSGHPPLAPPPLQGGVEGTPPTARAVSVSPAVGLPPATSWASSAPWESVALAADGTPPSSVHAAHLSINSLNLNSNLAVDMQIRKFPPNTDYIGRAYFPGLP